MIEFFFSLVMRPCRSGYDVPNQHLYFQMDVEQDCVTNQLNTGIKHKADCFYSFIKRLSNRSSASKVHLQRDTRLLIILLLHTLLSSNSTALQHTLHKAPLFCIQSSHHSLKSCLIGSSKFQQSRGSRSGSLWFFACTRQGERKSGR